MGRENSPLTDPRVVLELDRQTGIARITINNAERRNSYDPGMRL
jgi:enoyl-CoA hydratase